jgi:beta-lactamase class D
MKNIIALYIPLSFVWGCQNSDTAHINKQTANTERRIVEHTFDSILLQADVNGVILIYNKNENTYYSNNFDLGNNGALPASTFKITNSIIALEIGVVQSDSTIFKWNGEKRRLPVWEQDLSLRDAFHVSCVPCYQEIARMIGAERMKAYLQKFNYGNMQVDSGNIDVFWLEGDSKITPFEQLDFLKRFYYFDLPIKKSTHNTMKHLMIIDENANYTLSGKTGWAIRNENNTGWFTGYLEKENNVYFFVTCIQPKEAFNMEMFPKIRSQIIMQAFKQLNVVND